MTGLFARLRAWLGGRFDGETATDDMTDGDDGTSPQVVHRDDRPLETPTTTERPESTPSAASTGDERSDSAADTSAPDEPTVSIPDAEAMTGAPDSDDETTAGEDAASGGRSERTDAAAGAGAPLEGDPDGDVFACSVCGTTVDDPSAPCPLCRSTDVVPVAEAETDGEETGTQEVTRDGQTAVTTGDDEAVDRLRDVRDGE